MSYKKSNEMGVYVIQPDEKLFSFQQFSELFHYRYLIATFIKRDFIATYKQTILGPLWYLIQPLLMSGVFTIIFSEIAKISTGSTPPFIFYFISNILWGLFSSLFLQSSNVFNSNVYLFSKVYFPRIVVLFSASVSRLLSVVIQLLLFMLLMGLFMEKLHLFGFIQLIFPLFFIIFFALATGMLLSVLTIKYKDLVVLSSFGVQLYMYITPIIYPIDNISGSLKTLLMFNPLAPLIEYSRSLFFSDVQVDFIWVIYSIVVILILFFIAFALFNKTARTFIDKV